MEAGKTENIAADLARVIRGDVYDDIIHRAAFATDASIYQILPACVVAPKSVADIIATVKSLTVLIRQITPIIMVSF